MHASPDLPISARRNLTRAAIHLACSLVAFSGAALAQRVELPSPEQQPPRAQVPARWTPPTDHVAIPVLATGQESDLPFELTADPRPGRDGDLFGSSPIPAHLKGNPYRLAYTGGEYAPPEGQKLDPLLYQTWMDSRPRRTKSYGFVMFAGRITPDKLRQVQGLGVKLDSFHTFNSYTAVIPFDAIPALIALPAVRWLGYARPEQKVCPELQHVVRNSDPTTKRHLFVNVYESDLNPASAQVPIRDGERVVENDGQLVTDVPRVTLSNGPLQRALEAEGCKVFSYHDSLKVFLVEAPLGTVATLAGRDFVHYLELFHQPTSDHDRSTRQVGVDNVRDDAVSNGSDTVVGLLDSGAYMGGGRHVDLNKNGVGWNFGGVDTPWNDTNGHGTHVLGTVCGTGSGNNRYRGCAPGAGTSGTRRIFVGRILDAADYPNNTLTAFDTFRSSFTTGGETTPAPSVINNSWGYGSTTPLGWPGTDNISRGVDEHVFVYDQTYVFSNSNTAGTYAAPIWNSPRRPNVSKNALSVANVFDHRETVSGTTYETGDRWQTSGLGSTGDGRLKPNIAAPGRTIRSCQALTSNQYTDMWGTSMSSPHVTGIIAGLHTHYPATFKTNPARTKAWTCATANWFGDTLSWTQSNPSYYYRLGLGQIDAYKSHYQRDQANGFKSGWATGTLNFAQSGATFDVFVPADATKTMFVLNFDEKEASAGAVRACLADLDLILDVEPFSAAIDEGEFKSERAWDTWDWYANIGSINQVKGKNVRVKVHSRVRPGLFTSVRWGVGYTLYRGDTSPLGTLGITHTPLYPQTNEDITLTATVNVPTEIQTNTLLELSAPGFTVNAMGFTTPDGFVRSYTPLTLPGTNDSLFNWTIGHQGVWYTNLHSQLRWTMRRATSGNFDACVTLRADNRSPNNQQYCHTICVDGLAPAAISGLHSPTHTAGAWSSDKDIVVRWNAASDIGCSGLQLLRTKIQTSSCGTPTSAISAASTAQSYVLTESAAGWYFNLRAEDRAGNIGASSCVGPFKIDLTDPTISLVRINGGAAQTSSLSVTVATTAADALSGLSQMRFSSNNATWSAWQAYSGAAVAYDLSSNGGNGNEGTKTVYVQVRDLAGNVSASASDSISYLRAPVLAAAAPSSLPNVTDGYYGFSGTDLLDVTRVRFGATLLTSQSSDDWHAGYFVRVSDTEIRVFPPQASVAGAYGVRVENPAGTSNSVDVTVTYPTVPTLRTHSTLNGGKSQTIFVHQGAFAAATTYLVLAPDNLPSSLPRIVDLEIGNAFTTLVLVDTPFAHDPVTGVATIGPFHYPGGSPGATLYFEAILVTDPLTVPLPTSDAWQTKYL